MKLNNVTFILFIKRCSLRIFVLTSFGFSDPYSDYVLLYWNICVVFREKPVQTHLKNVYSLLSVGLIAATIGAYVFTASTFVQVIHMLFKHVLIFAHTVLWMLLFRNLVFQSWAFGILLFSAIASIASCCYIMFTQHTESQLWNRMAAFVIFTLATGRFLSPFLSVVR